MSDLVSDMDSFHSYFVLSHAILAACGCPSLDERSMSLVRDHIPVLLQGTMLCSIRISYKPQDPTSEHSALKCPDVPKFAFC